MALDSKGYERIYQPKHPLAPKDGMVYTHRAILFAKLGPGDHACTWCQRTLTWGVDLHVDHLDHDPRNNDPANLAPSCRPCNQGRRKVEPRSAGECVVCGEQFLGTYVTRKRYCAPRCRQRAWRLRENGR